MAIENPPFLIGKIYLQGWSIFSIASHVMLVSPEVVLCWMGGCGVNLCQLDPIPSALEFDETRKHKTHLFSGQNAQIVFL